METPRDRCVVANETPKILDQSVVVDSVYNVFSVWLWILLCGSVAVFLSTLLSLSFSCVVVKRTKGKLWFEVVDKQQQ